MAYDQSSDNTVARGNTHVLSVNEHHNHSDAKNLQDILLL